MNFEECGTWLPVSSNEFFWNAIVAKFIAIIDEIFDIVTNWFLLIIQFWFNELTMPKESCKEGEECEPALPDSSGRKSGSSSSGWKCFSCWGCCGNHWWVALRVKTCSVSLASPINPTTTKTTTTTTTTNTK